LQPVWMPILQSGLGSRGPDANGNGPAFQKNAEAVFRQSRMP
jgi:hypothetical protein